MKLLLYMYYLDLRKSLTFEQTIRLHEELFSETGFDETVSEIYTEICKKAARYFRFASRWLLVSKKERLNTDSSRTT